MTLWFRVDVDFVLSPQFLEQPAELRAAWLALHALAARSGGAIQGFKTWTPRAMDRSAGIRLGTADRLTAVGLASWCGTDGTDLAIHGFDGAGAKRARQKSEAARNAALIRWQADADALQTQMHPHGKADADASNGACGRNAVADAHHITVPNITSPPSNKGPGASGHEAPPAGMPDYPPLPDEPPHGAIPEPRQPFRRQEPPRYDRPNGATVAGSVTSPRLCARCGREGGSTVLEAGKNICRACYEKRPTADADARAAALELARRFGGGPLLADEGGK